uniref:Odorant binding protein 5 n=1 Tax=Dendroctonus ponderosae TaxID=77166 RepID=A0A0H3W5L2_DENPD|nr:odorant binding protein 5 [Dendroctonus ponderosae]
MSEKTHFALVALLLTCLVNIIDADQREKAVEFQRDCMEAHGLLEDELHEIMDGKPIQNEAFYFHFFCVVKKAKLISDNGIVNTDHFEENLKGVIDEENMAHVAALTRRCLIQRDDIFTTIKMAIDCFYSSEHKL